MGGAAKANGAGGGGPGGKRDTQGGTSFPAFDPTSKGSDMNFYPKLLVQQDFFVQLDKAQKTIYSSALAINI